MESMSFLQARTNPMQLESAMRMLLIRSASLNAGGD
jgi:hypothetical protein